MRNSHPRVRIVFVHTFNSDVHSVFTLQVTGCDFQYGSQSWLESNLSGQLICHLVVTYTHDMSLALQIVRTPQYVFVMKYCPTSTVFRNPASIQIFINRSCCGSLSTRSLCFCNRFSCAGISIEGVGVVTNKSAGAKYGSDCPATTSLPVLVRQLPYSSHKSETAP